MPSGLPGWTRAHLLTHVARNADALVNLLEWARQPVPKWHSGTPQEWRRWSAEARTAFPLHWLAVHDDAVREWSAGPS